MFTLQINIIIYVLNLKFYTKQKCNLHLVLRKFYKLVKNWSLTFQYYNILMIYFINCFISKIHLKS